MHKTPLFPDHTAAGAKMDIFGDWMLAAAFPAEPTASIDTAVDAEMAAARQDTVLFDLAPVQAVLLGGDSLRRFVNGMFTNKYTDVEPGQGRRSVMADDRGRVGGLVDWYCLADDRFLGVLEGVDADAFTKRFAMFMILDDIAHEALEDRSVLSIQGPGTDALLGRLGLPAPPTDHAHAAVGDDQTGDTLRVMRKDRTGLGGVDLLLPRAILGTTWAAALAAGATPAGQLALDALRILAGRAAWPQDGTDKSMVHELGYNVDSVSFDKGCYVGQEVINRIERRGGIRKRLTRIRLDDNAVPLLGAEVRQGENAVGTVSSAARVEGTVWALATLKQSAWEDGTKLVVGAGDQQVGAVVAAVS